MTTQEKNIKLAEWAGIIWKDDDSWQSEDGRHGILLPAGYYDTRSTMKFAGKMFPIGIGEQLPDYFSSLNAVHQLEERLVRMPAARADGQVAYAEQLFAILARDLNRVPLSFDFAHASAAQRCEALGKTLNLW